MKKFTREQKLTYNESLDKFVSRIHELFLIKRGLKIWNIAYAIALEADDYDYIDYPVLKGGKDYFKELEQCNKELSVQGPIYGVDKPTMDGFYKQQRAANQVNDENGGYILWTYIVENGILTVVKKIKHNLGQVITQEDLLAQLPVMHFSGDLDFDYRNKAVYAPGPKTKDVRHLLMLSKTLNEDKKNAYTQHSNSIVCTFCLEPKTRANIKSIQTFVNKLYKQEFYFLENYFESPALSMLNEALTEGQFRTAIISILVDSYAHNISAHSLVALENFFKARAKQLEAPIYINDNPQDINFPYALIDADNLKPIASNSEAYYKMLGLDDNTNTAQYLTFADIIKLQGVDFEKILTPKVNKLHPGTNLITGNREKYPLPVPVDDSLWKFMRFMKGKAAFWSGVTRDLPFGGQQISLYELLFKEFAQNSLFAGTIAATEGIYKLNIKVGLDPGFGTGRAENEIHFYDFIQIDTGLLQTDANAGNNSKILATNYLKFDLDKNIQYSKYGFLRLGKDFKTLRKRLTCEYVFMPGGIVGIHSFLTIVENTIRNVKHYKSDLDDMKANGLTLLVVFQKTDLLNIRVGKSIGVKGISAGIAKRSYKGEHRMYRVGLAIGNEVSDSGGAEDKIRQMLLNGIISTESGSAHLGGTSQDKICAAMLLNNKFMSVEKVDNLLAYYYPWSEPKALTVEELNKGDTFPNDEAELQTDYLQNLVYNIVNKKTFLNKRKPGHTEKDEKNGYLFKFFNLWHAQAVSKFESTGRSASGNKISELENYGRFKFLVVPDIKTYTRQLGEVNAENGNKKVERNVYRVIEQTEFDKEKKDIRDEATAAYNVWNRNIFKDEQEKILYYDLPSSPDAKDLNKILEYDVNGFNFKIGGIRTKPFTEELKNGDLVFAHGSTQLIPPALKYSVLNYRSHGVLIEQFARDKLNLPLGISDERLNEFLETLLVQVLVWDNRIYQRVSSLKHQAYSRSLRLSFFEEDNQANFVAGINKQQHAIYVVHLSFIEELYKASEKDSKLIDWFIEEKLRRGTQNGPIHYYEFSLCVISGRGNDIWYRSGVSEKYLPYVIFKPVESMMNAVSDAIDFNDDFQLKYNICKVLMG